MDVFSTYLLPYCLLFPASCRNAGKGCVHGSKMVGPCASGSYVHRATLLSSVSINKIYMHHFHDVAMPLIEDLQVLHQ
jgi:hypothetical protein